jgi:acetyltransferase-like isoleucine patch superfamily enzyme
MSKAKREKSYYIKLPYDAFLLLFLHLNMRYHRVSYRSKLRGNRCKIINKGIITLGECVDLVSCPDGLPYNTGLFAHLACSIIRIGNNCSLRGTVIHSRNKIIIGDNCMFGPGTVILDNDSHNTSLNPSLRRTGKIADKPVVIGNNVWVGMRSIIIKGVNIGDNSIIAAGSIVTRDIPSNQLFGGNPASFIRTLDGDSFRL